MEMGGLPRWVHTHTHTQTINAHHHCPILDTHLTHLQRQGVVGDRPPDVRAPHVKDDGVGQPRLEREELPVGGRLLRARAHRVVVHADEPARLGGAERDACWVGVGWDGV